MQVASGTEPDPSLLADLRDIESIGVAQSMLDVICRVTGMGFSAVARVTASRWTALAVCDRINFGLQPGGDLEVNTTLCSEVRESRVPIVIDEASKDETYCNHHTPRLYAIESYISVPIVLSDGEYFGNLCAIDPKPARVKQPHIVEMFNLFAQFIAVQLENVRRRKLAEEAVDVERANSALREQFIAIMGHDLRNPLAGITAGAQVLQHVADDPPAVRKVTERIGNSARRMKLLIDDVLDFARGRLGGGFGLNVRAHADLSEALEQVVDELRLVHPERSVEARLEIDRPVQCDLPRVQQLVSNLLANALVHGSPDAPVRLTAATDAERLTIRVTNRGDPIAPDLLPKLFEAFSKGAMLYDRKGLGLGLFICSQVVQAHRGTIEVSSDAHEGTTFTASLPVAGP